MAWVKHIVVAGLAVLVAAGCSQRPLPERAIQLPFEHPAADEVHKIFVTLDVVSEKSYRELPRRDRYVWDVGWFETEVMNGGVDQYMYNSAGDHAAECLEALGAIGAQQSYRLLKQACELFPGGMPGSDRETRQQQLHELTGPKHLDDLVDGELEAELYQHLLDYYRQADPDER